MDHANQTSRRHHYVPQFYLRAWQAMDGEGVWLYTRNIVNRITSHRRSPKSVGYKEDLYALKPEVARSVLNHAPDAIEKTFFSIVDDAAAIVHQKLITSGLSALSEQDRFNWALFLNSLIERNPKRIDELEKRVAIEEIKQEFAIRFKHSKILDTIDVAAVCHNTLRSSLVHYICDEAFVSYIANMRWATIDISHPEEHLLTSDMPLLINGGIGDDPIHLLSIALSPRRLLILHSDAEEFNEEFLRKLTIMHNAVIVDGTQRYLFSSRQVKDGPYTKYSRIVEERLNKV